jgi:RNA polymerase-binding transcription factor DksA
MNVTANSHLAHNSRQDGRVWNQLHAEREDIREALLKDYRHCSQKSSRTEATTTANWHRELLQSRLRKIDDALDRLMSGSYGDCSNCGRWIEDTKLAFDPAVAFCGECWQERQQNALGGRVVNPEKSL